MAYLDTRDVFLGASPFTAGSFAPAAAPAATATAGLDRYEWNIVALARREGLGSLRVPSIFSRLAGWLFGFEATRRLANPRLEALRRFAAFAWHHGYSLPVSAIKGAKEAGYSPDQLEELLARIARERTASRRGVRA